MVQRNITLDIAKGLGILLVVLGHNWITTAHHELSEVIYSFHMPLFFFLSGVLLKDSEPLLVFMRARLIGLMKPYLVVLSVVGLCEYLAAVVMQENVQGFGLKYVLGMLWGIGQSIAWPPLWFLPHLFIAVVFTLSILKLTKGLHPVVIALIFMLILSLGVYYIRAFWDDNRLIPGKDFQTLNGLPWSADLMPISSAFIASGYLLREQVKQLRLHYPALLLALLLFSALHVFFDVSMNLNVRDYGQPIVSSLQAGLGIYITLSLALLLKPYNSIQKALSYCGSGTLFILLFHGFTQNRVFWALSDRNDYPYTDAVISLLVALGLSLGMGEMAKKFRWVGLLFLPRRRI